MANATDVALEESDEIVRHGGQRYPQRRWQHNPAQRAAPA